MTIQKNSWHYRVYSWFTDREPRSVNLCPYARAVFLWAPLALLFGKKIGRIRLAWLSWPVVLTALPLLLWHFHKMQGLAFVLSMYAVLTCIVLGVMFLLWLEGRSATIKASLPKFRETLVYQYGAAVHNKVCPVIEVE